MERSRLSAVIITLNEEENIRRCLDSIGFTDEIILVDSGSEDNTLAIAREYPARIIFREMQGFGEQKQFAVEQATGDWILSIDADEWVSEELRNSLESLLSSPETTYDGYMVYRRNIFLGRPMRHCGWYRPILRLFKRGRGRFNDKLVHEEVHLDGKAGVLKGDLMHEPYKDIFHHLEKMERYARLDAMELIKRERQVYGWQAPVHLVLRPLWKFMEKYLMQQGFRDGIHGLILSMMAAFNVFLIHANCWQLQGNLLGGEKKNPG
ncbi:MAG: glycosyltransferase family 2 protein [Deltaproteobacteria bacterium]|nr:glycosyltransferase family 2 protein [Deltaproteobacteria bacterium]